MTTTTKTKTKPKSKTAKPNKRVTKQTRAVASNAYSKATADEIIRQMIEGTPISEITKQKDMPTEMTLFGWFKRNTHKFRDRMAEIRDWRNANLAHEIYGITKRKRKTNFEIADDKFKAQTLKSLLPQQTQTEHTGNVTFTFKTQIERQKLNDPKVIDVTPEAEAA